MKINIIFLSVMLLLSFTTCNAGNASVSSRTTASEEIANVKVLDITDHSCKVSWDGNEDVKTWLYVHGLDKIGSKHDAKNNYTYPSLAPGYTFTVFVQGEVSGKIKEVTFSTLSSDRSPPKTDTNEEVSNINVMDITDHSCKVTWEGNENVKTWLYVHELNAIGSKHNAKNNYSYPSLAPGYTFTVFVQGEVSGKIKEATFSTLRSDEVISNINVMDITDHSCKVTWDGSENVKTWLYVHELNASGSKHDAINNYTYPRLAPGYTFTVFVQGEKSGEIKKATFSTLTTQTEKEDTNPYLETVNIPEYDSSNSEHVLITTSNGNFSSSILNDTSKKHFYIQAGDYSANRIKLTSSGTSDNRRTLTLYDPNNSDTKIHPSKLNISEQANVSLAFDGASYWTVSRVSNINDNHEGSFYFINQSSNNILDKLNIKDYYYGIIIRPFCNNNTIQSSYLDSMTHEGTLSDNVGIAVTTGSLNDVVTSNTKIINNDIRNANDGIQLVRRSFGVSTGSFPGTIIDDNRIWMDGDIYTNGDYSTHGYSQDGQYMIGENAIDIKIGSDDVNNPLVITNNIMYGYQHGDATAGGDQDASYGTAFVAHYDIKNVVFEGNIIYNSERAFGIANPGQYSIYSAQDWTIRNNIFADIDLTNPKDIMTFGVYIYKAKNMTFENNIFSNVVPNTQDQGYFFRYEDTFGGCTFKNNIALNSYGTSRWYNHDDATKNDGVSIIDIDNNYFFNSPESMEGTNTHTVSDIDELDLENVTFTSKKIAVTETKTLIFK